MENCNRYLEMGCAEYLIVFHDDGRVKPRLLATGFSVSTPIRKS